MRARSHSNRLSGIVRVAAWIAVAIGMMGCSSYRMVEVWEPKTEERTFYHDYPDDSDVGLVCRLVAPGKAQVSVRVVNDGYLPVEIPMDLKLFVDGALYYSEVAADKVTTVKPGESKDILCRPVFASFVTRPVKKVSTEDREQTIRLYRGARVVYAIWGKYRTPGIVLDLAPENRIPFRFSEAP